MNASIETHFVEIIIPNDKNILVGIIYRPPNSLHDDFLNTFHGLLAYPDMVKTKNVFYLAITTLTY